MTILYAIVLATLHLENDDFVTFYKRVNNLYYYFRTTYRRCTDFYCAIVVNEQYFVKFNSLSCFCIFNVMYEKLFAFFCFKLLTVNFYNCVHILLLNGFPPIGDWHLPTLL